MKRCLFLAILLTLFLKSNVCFSKLGNFFEKPRLAKNPVSTALTPMISAFVKSMGQKENNPTTREQKLPFVQGKRVLAANSGTLVYALLGSALVISNLTLIVGNFHASYYKKYQYEWGLASTVFYGLCLGALSYFFVSTSGFGGNSPASSLVSMSVFLLNVALLGQGLYNIHQHLERKRAMLPTPFLHVSPKTGWVSGGVSVQGKF